MLATVIAIIIFIIFTLLGIAFILGWKSALSDKDVLHGVIFMWTVVAVLLATIFLAARYR
ncbi:MAG: hypothetical protein WC858_06300 [Parcubacteria group bacterium]